MYTFADIYGYDKIKEHLQNGIRMDKVSHAYIFNGVLGSGKKLMAGVFAAALQCEERNGSPCGKCHPCVQAESGNNPDIIWITREKKASIGVNEIREQLIGDIQIKPYSNRYKIYIIDEAEKLTEEAQNALLKTIEEPPEYGVIILLTTNADSFLPTILSRCVRLDFKPVGDDNVADYLRKNFDLKEYEIKFAVGFAQGNIGRAVSIATQPEFARLKESVLRIGKNAKTYSVTEIIAEVKEITEYKTSIDDYLDMCAMLYRDVLVLKSTNDPNALVFKDEVALVKSIGTHCSYEGLENILKAIDKVKIRLRANVNFELVMELMILTIKEAYH
jgi:DNA polymerase-3 subunit delta'